MNKITFGLVSIFSILGLVACGNGSGEKAASGGTESSGGGEMVAFVTTQDGSPLTIKPELFDTAQAKEFMTTGKNPYVGNAEAIEKGKKLFQLYSCTQCHGPDAKGQVGPNLTGPDYRYPKDATNKGMFETIWHGTNGGMGAKGKGLMDPSDPNNGLTVDETLKIIAWIRSHGNSNGNE